MAAHDTEQFLADSPDRSRLLSHLRTEPGAPRDVADALSISRRSAQRNLGAFADRGWAEKSEGVYRLTTTGALVADRHAAYVEDLEVLGAFEPFLGHLPDAEHAPEIDWLRDADLAVATPENPQAPVHFYVSRLRAFDTDTIEMVSPVLSRLFHEAHGDLVLQGVQTELVLAGSALDRARSLDPAEFDVVARAVDLYRHPSAVGVGLTVADDRLLACVYDDDGQLRACVESGHEAFVTWGRRLVQRYRARAEPVGPAESRRQVEPGRTDSP